MSLVERALKKLQEAQQGNRKPPALRPEPEVVGSVVSEPPTVEVEVTPGARAKAPVVKRSDKIVRIDRSALRRAGLLPPEQQERRLSNEYRAIKRPIVSGALGRGTEKLPKGRLVMVASALPGEGKTFTSMNLALSMALEKDVTVLLVDADVAKPHISRTFGMQQELGLVDALVDHSLDVESLVIPTDIPGLSLLPSGSSAETATELLASSRMESIVARLAEGDAHRIVLFDSPPLLLTSESKALASVVGQVVVIVRAGITERPAVLEALSHIPPDKALGLVLNQSEMETSASYYGYGGEYGDPAAAKKPRA